MSNLLGDEFPAFEAALQGMPVSGLRVNTLKLTAEQFERISPVPLGARIPWCPAAYTLDGTDRPGKHPYHLAGLFYLQDPSAMAPAELLAPQPGERVLDLAAAPGGKTTQLAARMQGRGLLVANEIKTKRVNHLTVNVQRWGAGNVVICNETPERLADHFGPYFDRVLVDAPCSGEGMFRKDMGARLDWSLEMVAGCAVRQGNILHVAAKLVRPGGHLLYSTCTFAPEEDEGVITRFLDRFPDYQVVPLPQAPGFQPGRPEWLTRLSPDNPGHGAQPAAGLSGAVRLFPHRLQGEGHFACLLRRGEAAQPREIPGPRPRRPARAQLGTWTDFARATLALRLDEERMEVRGERLYLAPQELPDMGNLRVLHPGVWLGNLKKDRFEPAHPLALFLSAAQAGQVIDLPVGSQPLAAYLRGETLACEAGSGWVLVCAGGWPLGWGKRVQGRLKNHYPHGWQVYS
jgi:NOL1/NOP2/sun family putative RNA methylase